MLTKSELEIFSRIIELPGKLGFLPFDWDQKAFRLRVTSSKWRNTAVVSAFIANALYFLFLVYQIPATFGRKPIDINDMLFHSMFLVSSAGSALFKWTLWSSKHDVVVLVNNTIYINCRIGRLYLGKQYLEPCRREKLFRASVQVISLCSLLFCLSIAFNTDKAFMLHALIPLGGHGVISRILFGLAEIFFKVDLLLPISFIFVTCFLYFFSVQFWLNQICIEWPICSQITRKPCLTRCIKIYRSICVLNTIANQVLGRIIIPVYDVIFVVGITGLIFGLIRLRHVLDTFSKAFILLTILDWPIEMMMTLNVMASLTKYSAQLVPNLQRNFLGKSRIIRKYYTQHINSLRPIQCRLGVFYNMRRNASLRTADYVINGVNYLLVTIK